jgi:hypothetical protein
MASGAEIIFNLFAILPLLNGDYRPVVQVIPNLSAQNKKPYFSG